MRTCAGDLQLYMPQIKVTCREHVVLGCYMHCREHVVFMVLGCLYFFSYYLLTKDIKLLERCHTNLLRGVVVQLVGQQYQAVRDPPSPLVVPGDQLDHLLLSLPY